MNIAQVLESTKKLTASEKALLAHCLISSLDTVQDNNVEEAWFALAEQRAKQLDSGLVQGISWEDIKKNIQG